MQFSFPCEISRIKDFLAELFVILIPNEAPTSHYPKMSDTENSNSGTETEESDDSLLDLEIEFQNQIPHPATMVHLGKKAI